MKNANSKSLKIQGAEKPNHFSKCFLSYTLTDGRLMAVNDKYLALTWMGKGKIKLLDSHNPMNLSNYYTTISCESADILDMEFSPFDNNVLSFSNEDKNVCIYKFEEMNEDSININSEFYSGHSKKVGFINFNPVASNIMCSSTSYGEVNVWESKEFKTYTSINLQNNPNFISWSPNGDLVGISMKNKNFYVFDPRMKKLENPIQISYSTSNSKFAWIDNYTVATIGFGKNADKILGLLDLRKNNSLNSNYKFVSTVLIDKFNSLTIPYVNPELKLIYTVGKEESYMKIFDFNTGSLEKYGDFKNLELNNFSIHFNRQYLNKQKLEIDRFARYTKERNIYYVSFYLQNPEDFNGIVYPNEELSYPQITHKDWINGKKFEAIPKKVYKKKPTQDNYNNIQNQEYDFDNNNSLDINRNELANNSNTNNNYTQKFLIKKQNQNRIEPLNKYKNNQPQKNMPSKQQPINYEDLYKNKKQEYENLSIEYSKLENSLKEHEQAYVSEINALKKKLEVETNKYKEEINKNKNLLQNKNNPNLLSPNLANYPKDNKNQKLENEYNKLKQILNGCKENEEKSSKNIAKLKSQINEKISLLQQKEKEIQDIQNTLKEKQNIINNLTDEKRNNLNEKAMQEQNLNELNKELSQLKKEINIKNNEKSEFGKQKNLLENNIKDLTNKNNYINNKYDNIKKKNQELTKENNDYKGKLEE